MYMEILKGFPEDSGESSDLRSTVVKDTTLQKQLQYSKSLWLPFPYTEPPAMKPPGFTLTMTSPDCARKLLYRACPYLMILLRNDDFWAKLTRKKCLPKKQLTTSFMSLLSFLPECSHSSRNFSVRCFGVRQAWVGILVPPFAKQGDLLQDM